MKSYSYNFLPLAVLADCARRLQYKSSRSVSASYGGVICTAEDGRDGGCRSRSAIGEDRQPPLPPSARQIVIADLRVRSLTLCPNRGYFTGIAAACALAIDNARLIHSLQVAEERLREEALYLREELAQLVRFETLIGESPGMREVYRLIERIPEHNGDRPDHGRKRNGEGTRCPGDPLERGSGPSPSRLSPLFLR